MNQIIRRSTATVLAGMLLMSHASACQEVASERMKDWTASVRAPASVIFWKGAGREIVLPAARDAFIEFIVELGADHYVTGESVAAAMSAPAPRDPSPCQRTEKAIVFSFPEERNSIPRYVAYLNAEGLVECVDKQFSYSASP